MIIDYDANNNPIYIGYSKSNKTKEAEIKKNGSSIDESIWKISKLLYDGNNNLVSKKFAEGTQNFNKTWSERTSYNYY